MSRPAEGVKGHTTRTKTGCGSLYVTDNTDGDYKEIFLKLGKPGGCPACFLQALAMITSLALRHGVEKAEIVKCWEDISCPSPCWDGSKINKSCPDAIARVLKTPIEE